MSEITKAAMTSGLLLLSSVVFLPNGVFTLFIEYLSPGNNLILLLLIIFPNSFVKNSGK